MNATRPTPMPALPLLPPLLPPGLEGLLLPVPLPAPAPGTASSYLWGRD